MNASPLPHGYSSAYVASYPYVVRERRVPGQPNYQRSYYADPDDVPSGVNWCNSQCKAQHYTRSEAHRMAAWLDGAVVHIVPRPYPGLAKGGDVNPFHPVDDDDEDGEPLFSDYLAGKVSGLRRGREEGAAVAFGLMGMAEAIRNRPCESCELERHHDAIYQNHTCEAGRDRSAERETKR